MFKSRIDRTVIKKILYLLNKLKKNFMKKITLLAVAVIAMSFASCKKNYTCTCSGGTAGSDITYTAKMKKSDADTWCTSWNTSFKTAYPSGSCSLK
jgi:hypothetical protein